MADFKPDPITDKEAAAIIRDMIRHEDSVLNQRLTWCVTIEGLLLASLAFAWEKASVFFVCGIAVAGALVAVSTFYASWTTVKTMHTLTQWWGNKSADYNGPDVIGLDTKGWNPVLRPSRAIPGIFFLLWTWIIIVRFLWPK